MNRGPLFQLVILLDISRRGTMGCSIQKNMGRLPIVGAAFGRIELIQPHDFSLGFFRGHEYFFNADIRRPRGRKHLALMLVFSTA